jgi:hypothetical protein
MNFCRTCKYWAVNSNAIGLGNCTNLDVLFRLIALQSFSTTQNFGCVLHESGICTRELEPYSEQSKKALDFMNDRAALLG